MAHAINCLKARGLLNGYLAGELSPEHVLCLETHFAGCPGCRTLFVTYRKTVSLCRELPVLDFPEELHRRIMDGLQKSQVRQEFTLQVVVVKAKARGATPGVEGAFAPGCWIPPVDLFEFDAGLVLKAFLPGIDRGDIRLRVGSRSVIISSPPPAFRSRGGEAARALKQGGFFREVALPLAVDPGKSSASYRDGILKVCLPRQVLSEKTFIPATDS